MTRGTKIVAAAVLNAFASDVASDEFQQICCAAKPANAVTASPAAP